MGKKKTNTEMSGKEKHGSVWKGLKHGKNETRKGVGWEKYTRTWEEKKTE